MLRANSVGPTAQGGKLHLFSIYTDFGSCRRVKWMAGTIAKLAGHRWQCRSEMWKLDSLLSNGAMGKMLAGDAAAADVLIVVVSSLSQRRPELMDWLASLPPQMPLRQGLFIGLLGDEEDKGEELDWTVKQLVKRAQENNRKFVWHWIGHHDTDASEWLAAGVEGLLASKQAVPKPMLMPERATVWQAA
ncbi:MAG TPA: hypothetical protein VH280_24875 [Verrucomicrobiae bacterium]|jgi:hypothetical protein|nr:hypothetical protein [Verrucomicrobiae bacterium]